MSLSSRTLRCSVLGLLPVLTTVCAAQPGVPQFIQPIVEYTGGRVTSFVPGALQGLLNTQDILFINAATGSGATSSVLAGELLSLNQGQGFTDLSENQITFSNVSNVVAALGDFNHDGIADYAFALTPAPGATGVPNLCVYYGTGLGLGGYAYDEGRNSGAPPQYPPAAGGKSGCFTFATRGTLPPVYSAIVAFPYQNGSPPQLLMEDSANGYIYVLSNNGVTSNNGVLTGFTLVNTIPIAPADGPGPIYMGDFDHDGNIDFIVNGQTGDSATIYFGNGDGSFLPPVRLALSGTCTFSGCVIPGHAHSMLLQDMNGDGIPDLVVEADNGVIQIYPGAHSRSNPFATASAGGTAATPNGFAGNGGHLAAIDPISLNIFTTTAIGLSVLKAPPGTLNYSVQGIYNIGPGRSTFALGQFRSNGGYSSLAVDSPEGVAIVLGNANGGFQTSNAYSALAPALGATIAQFRNIAIDPGGALDVVVSTGAAQGQLLINNGTGGFTTFGAVTNTNGPIAVPGNLWSNVLSGDFNNDGAPDLAYTLTGLPLPSSGTGLYIQYGRGDGTFQAPLALTNSAASAPSNNLFFGESATGDFNGDGYADIANIDAAYDDTVLGHVAPSFSLGFNHAAGNTAFSQVAAGFFKVSPSRTNKQDLVFQQGSQLIPYLNNGSGGFTAMAALQNGPPSSMVLGALMVADLDGDNNSDIVAVYYNPTLNPATTPPVAANQLYIWWGNGDGTFSATPFAIPLTRNNYLGAVGDMNSDGRPDLVLADGQIVTVLYNLGGRTTAFKSDFGTNCSPCGGEQHFLAGQGINSLTLASVSGSNKPDVVVANGGVTLSNPLALGGTTQSSIALAADPDIKTGGITVLANNIGTRPVTGTLSVSPEPSSVGATFTLTATITPTAGVPLPTGTVEFYIGTTGGPVSNFVPIVPGTTTSTASFTIPAGNIYASGVYPISAFYSGDSNNSLYTINGTHAISNSGTTTTLYLCIVNATSCPVTGTIVPPPPPYPPNLTMYYGQDFNGVTQASANDGSTITGTIAFNDVYNGVLQPTLCTLAAGQPGACPPSVGTTLGTSPGTNVFTSVYSGDATHTGSTSPAVTINVVPDLVTATISSSLNPATQTQPITFSANFTGNFAAPTGIVSFYLGTPATGTLLGATPAVNPGSGLNSSAQLVIRSLAPGTYTITAVLAGSPEFNSASATLTEVVTFPSFTLAVTPTAVTGFIGDTTALEATITAQNSFTFNVNLSCGNLPSEASCTFIPPTISGHGSSTLIVSITAPHTCGTTQPYFTGSIRGGPLVPFALPALAGLAAICLPGRRRWLRALVVLAVAAAALQMTGCGNCTDLGTRPGTYTFDVIATFPGSGPTAPPETQSVPVTITVTI